MGITKEEMRAALEEADFVFPTPKDGKIKARACLHNPRAFVEQVRLGDAEIADIPWMLPSNIRTLSGEYADYRENRFDRRSPADLKKYRELLTKAGNATQQDMTPHSEMAEYRKFELTCDVLTTPWTMAAFQIVNLNADELPLIERPQSFNLNAFTVRSIGVDGGASRDQWRTTKSAETYEMNLLSTDRVEYALMDLQQGDVSQADAVDKRLRFEMEMKLDALGKTNIDAAKVTSGLRDTLNIHSMIDTANIPDTNYLDLSGVDTAGELSITKLKRILLHVSKFGAAGGADVPISINTVMMSPQNIEDPWNFIDLVSDFDDADRVKPLQTVPTPVREQIFNTGMITSAWGHQFSWTPNAQLAKGKMYILTSEPLGWAFTKPEFDKMLTWDERNSPDHAANNMGEMLWRKAIRFLVPDLWRYRIVIVDL